VFFIVTYGPRSITFFGDFSVRAKHSLAMLSVGNFGNTSNHAALSPFEPLSTQTGAFGMQTCPAMLDRVLRLLACAPGLFDSGWTGDLLISSLLAGLLLHLLDKDPSSVDKDLWEALLNIGCGSSATTSSVAAFTACSCCCELLSETTEAPESDA